MGTLVDNGGCSFDGEIKNWLPFRQKLCRSSDGMGLGWVYEISNVLSAYLQKAVAEMSKKDREAGGIVTDFSKFSVAQLKNVGTVLSKSQGSFLLKQALIRHRKDTFGSNYMDHVKCGYKDEDELTEAHEQCDLAYLIKANRQFIMLLHDAVYPKGSKLTKATTKLQSLLDGPLVKKVLQGTSLGDEDEWGEHAWLIPAISTLTRLCFRMEGMTELVNDTFIEDLSTLLSSCTDGKHRKTFFEIDKEFESMTTVVKSNFVTVDSFLLSMRASLRQALIRKLAHVKSPDQAAWMKAEDYIAGLLNDDQMLTIETTDHAIKIFEN